ncbi:MAG TPA: GNAT family N-acetyltransferase [Sumerlaeia bacterium]|nr:GNAT family N-acetyltransferase [Sumerlaeia bacterium]
MEPTLSMEIKRLRPGAETLARDAVAVFGSTNADIKRMAYLLGRDDCFFLVAVEASQAIGFLLAYEFQGTDTDVPAMFLSEIGVAATRRRHGIARALVNQLKAICRKRGTTKVLAVANEADEPATKFLEATGARRDGKGDALFVYNRNALE